MILRSLGRFLAALFQAWPHLLLIAILIAVAFFWVEIDPVREYGFGSGVLHGFFGMQNLILFCFTDHEFWAPSNTGRGYTAGFYVGLCLIPAVIRTTLEIVVFILKRP
ncbi:MAG: hypothetical protein ABUT39_04240 [Acidobacteriota bacterium]